MFSADHDARIFSLLRLADPFYQCVLDGPNGRLICQEFKKPIAIQKSPVHYHGLGLLRPRQQAAMLLGETR